MAHPSDIGRRTRAIKIRLSHDDAKRLEVLAARSGLTVSGWIVEEIHSYYDRAMDPRKVRAELDAARRVAAGQR